MEAMAAVIKSGDADLRIGALKAFLKPTSRFRVRRILTLEDVDKPCALRSLAMEQAIPIS